MGPPDAPGLRFLSPKQQFLQGAQSIPGLHVFGLACVDRRSERTSTFAVAKEGWTDPDALTRHLVHDHGIYCTSGNHYCTFWDETFPGIRSASNETGAVRLGFLHYNTSCEVDRVLNALEQA